MYTSPVYITYTMSEYPVILGGSSVVYVLPAGLSIAKGVACDTAGQDNCKLGNGRNLIQ